MPRQPRHAPAFGVVCRDARQRLGERCRICSLENGVDRVRGVVEGEGVRGRLVAPGGRAEGAEAAAGGLYDVRHWCTNTSKHKKAN